MMKLTPGLVLAVALAFVPASAEAQVSGQCNQGPYIVFFDANRATITPEAGTILTSAAIAYANCGTAPVSVVGHTDRSGPDAYNVRLAQRRNAAVRRLLIRGGIPGTRISSEAVGEARERVPTAEDAREPQNRRVEITYGTPAAGS